MREQLDLDFKEYVIPPAETYADTMRLYHGWSSPARDPDGELLPCAAYVADMDGVEEHIEAMQRCVAALYVHFGGTEDAPQEVTATTEDLRDVFQKWHDLDMFEVWSSEDECVALAERYLQGNGDDYKDFWKLVTLHGLEQGAPSTEPPEWW